jgi:hypothetical protein
MCLGASLVLALDRGEFSKFDLQPLGRQFGDNWGLDMGAADDANQALDLLPHSFLLKTKYKER